jgi:acetyl esterase/lipase
MSADILTLPAPAADARLPYGPQPSQFGYLYLPVGRGSHPLVVYLHGGFWRVRFSLEHAGHVCAALAADGLAVWSLEYRRIGETSGGWPGTFHDVGRGADAVRQLANRYSLDLGRVLVMGHSAGGQLALWLAGRHRLRADSPLWVSDPLRPSAALSLAGVCDLRQAAELRLSNSVVLDLLGGPPEAVPERYADASPIELLPLGMPQTLIHGTADENVPYALSEHYAAAAQRAGDRAELVTLPGVGHFEVIDARSDAWPTVLATARRLIERVR